MLTESTYTVPANSFSSLGSTYHLQLIQFNPFVIKNRLGHEDIKTTLSTYSHLYPNVNFEITNNMTGSIKSKTSEEKRTKFQGNQSFKYFKN